MDASDLVMPVTIHADGSASLGEVKSVAYNPHIPCDLQGGHDWQKTLGKNYNDVSISLEVCTRCSKVRA